MRLRCNPNVNGFSLHNKSASCIHVHRQQKWGGVGWGEGRGRATPSFIGGGFSPPMIADYILEFMHEQTD